MYLLLYVTKKLSIRLYLRQQYFKYLKYLKSIENQRLCNYIETSPPLCERVASIKVLN